MCGIVGFIGRKPAQNILLEGLRRLEYRGYDSAGLCTLTDHQFQLRKKAGRIQDLAALLRQQPATGTCGIGHTRWATHGPPTDVNAHPHLDQSGRLALVHNGVIENYHSIREHLTAAGHQFQSQTDTEVLAHLIGHHYDLIVQQRGKPEPAYLVEAVRRALKEVIGTYGIALLHADHPGLIIGARRGSPLLIGVGRHENFLASDVSAIVAHTRRVVYLNDFEIVTVTGDDFQVTTLDAASVTPEIREVEFTAEDTERGRFPHYMLKEIFEQPQAVQNAYRGRISHDECTAKLGGLNLTPSELRAVDRIVFVSCGTALHAGMVGEYLMEELARIPTEWEYASEFRYRNAPIEKNTLVFAISQSGETIDTLAAVRESRRKGHKTLAIVNVVGSTIAREVDGGVYMHAGPEIGVAATKTFTSQLTVMVLLSVLMGRMRHLSAPRGAEILRELERIPGKIERILAQNDTIATIAKQYAEANSFLFLARQHNYPIALEGALKLKEISYIHAEGYPAAEMKHGPIALVEPRTPSVFICPQNSIYEKTLANIEEVRARKGPVIAVGTEGDTELAKRADHVLYVPSTLEVLEPLLTVVPLQLLAYHIALCRGCDVDKPRNLAKSVTVE
ncbi:MAG: glutamine--fructose-6-phosphate transaminase (isomerizing) [Verrucomicrobiae bacterium]|nr:glutamine--fructose-6-phosphate transaminase (isomerizing) [Verrucomicrobiae bacterium]MDW8344256.1 glutamine--fructose-6-phosphate transaminase (isomerizing) [Verrucomicrobiae bacterium]